MSEGTSELEKRSFEQRIRQMTPEGLMNLRRHLQKISSECGRLYDIMQSDVGKWAVTYFDDEIGITRQMYRTIPMGMAPSETSEQLRSLQAIETKLIEMRDRMRGSPAARDRLDLQIQLIDNLHRSARQSEDIKPTSLVPDELKHEGK